MSVSSVVCTRYAGVLIDLAGESGAVEKVQQDLRDIKTMIKNAADFADFISSPLAGRERQRAVMRAIAKQARLQPLTAHFLGVLVENRRLNALSGIITAYEKIIAARSGAVTVRVETAVTLTEAQEKAFREKLSKALNADVAMETAVTPEILGGSVVTIGSYMIDDSVRRKLERLNTALKQGANQNNQNLKEVV